LLYRYETKHDSGPVLAARIYTGSEHPVDRKSIDRDALNIVRRLTDQGFQAYVVGGAVRDLILGRTPKDFDVATDARPRQVRRLFRRSRVIGRRFRLVHVYFGQSKIIEVSTFRSSSDDTNTYGTLGEDAFRRDFSFNALFYCPIKNQIIDYVDGVADIRRRRVRVLGNTVQSFREDPVRIIRAVKYGASLNLSISLPMRMRIRKLRFGLRTCSPDRLTEEVFKILESGDSAPIVTAAYRLGVLEILAPAVHEALSAYRLKVSSSPLMRRLAVLDGCIRRNGSKPARREILSVLLIDLVRENPQWYEEKLALIDEELKETIKPLVSSGRDIHYVSRAIKHTLKTGVFEPSFLGVSGGLPYAGAENQPSRRT